MTISEMARQTEVHESSLVRFATSFGLDGYPALVELCRQHLADQAQLVRRFEHAQRNAEAGELLAGSVANDERNLARTFARVSDSDWKKAIRLLAHAPNIHVMALRKCFAIGYLLVYLLRMVRPRVRQITGEAGLLVDELRDMTKGDVFVAIAIHRYTTDTVRALRYAKQNGLKTIVLTDSAASPLVSYGDVVFYVDTSSFTLLRSLTAFTSFVQALATGVALDLGARSRSELAEEEKMFEDFAVLTDAQDVDSLASVPRTRRPKRPLAHDTNKGNGRVSSREGRSASRDSPQSAG